LSLTRYPLYYSGNLGMKEIKWGLHSNGWGSEPRYLMWFS
jgi:hypothetical protein